MTEDDWPSDATIESYLSEKTDVPNQKWAQRRINGLKVIDNPILDSAAKQLFNEEANMQGNPTVNVLSTPCAAFDTNTVYEVPNQYMPGRQLVFRSELSDATINKPINPRVEVSGIAAQFANQSDCCDSLNINLNPSPRLYQWQYLLLDVDDLTVPGTNFEPIVCSVFVIDNKKIVSQRWNFFTPYSRTFFDCKVHSQQAAIDVSGVSDGASLAVIYYRIFQIDNGDVCDSYYKKPSETGLKKARESVNTTILRLKDCWTPFAFSYVSLKSIQGTVDFPNALLPEKSLTGDYIAQQIDKVKGKLDSLPITLKLKSQMKKVSHPSQLSEDYIPIRSIMPDVNQPIFELRHQMIITLGAAKFDLPSKVNARNIVAQISFYNGDKTLTAIHNSWKGSDLCENVFSRCIYHEKNPVYDDEFIIDLPINIDPQARIEISYYHAATQEKEQALRLIATATLPLMSESKIIPDGNSTVAINYPKTPPTKPTPNNCQIIKTQLYSTIISQDPFVLPMFSNKKIIPAIDHISDSVVINLLFPILDSLIESITLSQPKASVFGIISLGRLISTIQLQQLSDLLNFYATSFAFRKEDSRSVNVHNSILKHWLEYLNKEEKVRKDIPVSSFLFTIIFKSIVATNDRNFGEAFMLFFQKLKELNASFPQASLMQAKIFNEAFAKFIGELTDIGFYELAGQLITEYSASFSNTESDNEALVHFLNIAIHPKLFMALSLAQDNFIPFFKNVMSKAIMVPESRSLQLIFKIFGRLLLFVPEKNCDDIASKYMELMEIFTCNEIKIKGEELRYLMSVIVFIFKYVRQFEFQEVYNNLNHAQFNTLLHFVLTKTHVTYTRQSSSASLSQPGIREAMQLVRKSTRKSIHASTDMLVPVTSNAVRDALISSQLEPSMDSNTNLSEIKELSLDAQISVIHVMTHILTIYNPDAPALVLDMIYHILSSNICIDIARLIKDIVFLYIEKNANALLISREPPFALFLMKLFSMIAVKNSFVSDELVAILPRFFSAELRLYPTNNRSYVCAIRAISKMKDEDVESPTLRSSLESRIESGGNIDKILNCIKTITELNIDMRMIDPEHFRELRQTQIVKEASKNETNIEKYSEDILLRSKAYAASPDACSEEIQYLAQYNSKNQYLSESMMTRIYQIALIVEYLTLLKRIPNAYDVQHPALVFKDTCTSVTDHICPDEILNDLPIVPSYCDSPIFSDAGINIILQEINSFCKQAKLFEISNELVRLTYPLFEQRNLYKELSTQFTKTKMSYQVMMMLTSNMDRMLGRYYRIAYYGKIFGTDDGKMFVQRETKLAHLFDVTGRIKATYINLFGPDKIEIITESGFVDRKLLDPEKGYIQLTYVEPYFEKSELENRVTVYECGNKLTKFKFETPFVKGEKKLQGSVETQWQRRTILKVDAAMPAILKRVEVPKEGYIVIEYEPIRVSIRQIKDRLISYELALKTKEIQAIQPLLHGSLLVQVNEGPTKMAEVFLGSPLRTKYTEKMRRYFQQFLNLNAEALSIHGAYVRNNPSFQELQNQLEEGFRNLTAKLTPYLYPK